MKDQHRGNPEQSFESRILAQLLDREEQYFRERKKRRQALYLKVAVVTLMLLGGLFWRLFLPLEPEVWSEDKIRTVVESQRGFTTMKHCIDHKKLQKELSQSYRAHAFQDFAFDALPQGYHRQRSGFQERFSWAEFTSEDGGKINFDILFIVGGKSNLPLQEGKLEILSTEEQIYYYVAGEAYSFVTWVNEYGDFSLTALGGYEQGPVSAEELLTMARSFHYLGTKTKGENRP